MTQLAAERANAAPDADPKAISGLTSEEARRRLAERGSNKLDVAKGPSHLRRFLANLVHLFALLLWAGAALAFVGGLPELSIAAHRAWAEPARTSARARDPVRSRTCGKSRT